MPLEPRLEEMKGPSRLALGFFNSIIRRIECTKPISSGSIKCIEKEDGIQINGTAVTINVCSNGIPEKLVILYDEKRTDEANQED